MVVRNKNQALVIPCTGKSQGAAAGIGGMVVEFPAIVRQERSALDVSAMREYPCDAEDLRPVKDASVRAVIRPVHDILFELEADLLRKRHTSVQACRHRLKGGLLGSSIIDQ